MALPWVLAVLSLLPLLDAQNQACTSYTVPITRATLKQVSGKKYPIALAYRYPDYKESTRDLKAGFFYMTPKYRENKIHLKEYSTIGDECVYRASEMYIHRKNGTLYVYDDDGKKHYGHFLQPKDRSIFMLVAFPDDPQSIGISFFSDNPVVTPEQMEQFRVELRCRGMDESEVLYLDPKKDRCKALEEQQEQGRKKKNQKTKKVTG